MRVGACNRICGADPWPSGPGDTAPHRDGSGRTGNGSASQYPRVVPEGFVEAASIAASGRAIAAARAFAAGNGYLPGQIVDHIV